MFARVDQIASSSFKLRIYFKLSRNRQNNIAEYNNSATSIKLNVFSMTSMDL